MDYKEVWCEAYDEAKEAHPEWTEKQLSQAATDEYANRMDNLYEALKDRNN